MELVTGNGPMLKTVGALGGNPSAAGSARGAVAAAPGASVCAGNGAGVKPASTSNKIVILISRIVLTANRMPGKTPPPPVPQPAPGQCGHEIASW